MIIAFELSFTSESNIELQRAFACLNLDVKFSSSSTIKNYLMRRCENIQSELLSAFSNDDIKVFLSLNCWSSFNRQEYLVVNAYFIDNEWYYMKYCWRLSMFQNRILNQDSRRLCKISLLVIIYNVVYLLLRVTTLIIILRCMSNCCACWVQECSTMSISMWEILNVYHVSRMWYNWLCENCLKR
jgi:hypothetical protein